MFHSPRQKLTTVFILIALAAAIASLVYSNKLAKELAREERNKMEVWAAATGLLAEGDESADMSLVLKVLQRNTTIPIILYDKNSEELTANNIAFPNADTAAFLLRKKTEFAQKHDPIELTELNQQVYYDDSTLLKRLQLYPYVQMGVMAVFIALAFFALVSTQKAERDNLWVGLSKETAHQLGTPLSSLVAWTEYLKLKAGEENIIGEIEKDVVRLNMIADRFSKIGSAPDLHAVELQQTIKESVAYLQKRISDKVVISYDFPLQPLFVRLNESLFGWVVENLTKNAVDAMSGQGTITYSMGEKGKYYFLDITDTGKGIPKSKFNSVFMPGFTTKERGWGLGLSLAKRIVEQYHSGKIFVAKSEIGKGTTFRVLLKKAE